MSVLEILGYFSAVLIGVVLGLLGGGGSILTVPVLVYLMSVNPVVATAYSLFVVGVSSLVGTVRNLRLGTVDVKTGVVFAIPAFLAVYLTRKFVVPAIPETVLSMNSFELTKDMAIMIFFGIIMVAASVSMIRGKKKASEAGKTGTAAKLNIPLIVVEGAVVGTLTGIVGAGGGFLIIPALVVLAKLPMKTAVGTSLMIISIKSLIGFLGDLQTTEIDWAFLAIFTALATLGIFFGIYLNKFVDGQKLKKGFGWFVLVMGGIVILKEMLG